MRAVFQTTRRRGGAALEAALTLPFIVLILIFFVEMIFVFSSRAAMYIAAARAANVAMEVTRGYNPYSWDNSYPISEQGLDAICQAVLDTMRLASADPERVTVVVEDSVTPDFGTGRCMVRGGGDPQTMRVRVEYAHPWFHARLGIPLAPEAVLSVDVLAHKQVFLDRAGP